MNLLSWFLALTILILLLMEAVTFHRATVCRQRAWLKSFELKTRTLLHSPKASEKKFDLKCSTMISRSNLSVKWKRPPLFKSTPFELDLEGKL